MERLDAVINRLIDTDQVAGEIDLLALAKELGEIRARLVAMPTVHRSADDRRHFRCESCNTISHGEKAPARCARCGKSSFLNVDIE